jgi:hypothetical protein
MAERTKAAVLKTAEPLAGSVGSNPTPSAKKRLLRKALRPVSLELNDLGVTSRGTPGARWGRGRSGNTAIERVGEGVQVVVVEVPVQIERHIGAGMSELALHCLDRCAGRDHQAPV